ncbi:Rab family GTPase [Myxosarcina sp. GI1]|uniref:Rab family GTPase n=1 Tax=Myxosarcina sp. GI1 TaxID=1541065 RepID=UPI00055E5D41|nr:Rab family GTPase [Myxosarcina sp. GI1]
MSIISKKICLVGDFGVGKTSLMRRFVDRQFSDRYLSTIGVKISRKIVRVAAPQRLECQKVQLLIWDVEGQTKFQPVEQNYLRGCAGAIVVADLSRQDTISRLYEHLNLVSLANPRGVRAIAAFNKSDLLTSEKLATVLQEKKYSQNVPTYITSAKTGKNVEQIFQKLVCLMLDKP